MGVDVLPRHFYSSIPDVRALRAQRGWRAAYSMVDLQGALLDAELAFVRSCCGPAVLQRLGPKMAVYDDACRENGAVGYGPVEALLL